MKLILRKTALIGLVLFANSLFAATYYVSKSGNDSNSGSESAPFATFNHAVSIMSAGDTCIIKGGVYEEPLIINKNGANNNFITFKAEDGEKVELKATSPINGWQLHSGNIYKTTVNMSIASRFRAVYHNGEYQDLARWPNNTDNNRWTVNCAPLNTSDGGDGSHFDLKDPMPNIDWSNGGIVYYLGAHSGTSWSRPVLSNTTTTINFPTVDIASDWPFTNHNPTQWRDAPGNNRGQLFLFNKLEALDYAREWFYDENTNTLYIQTADGNIPSTDSVEYATRKYAVELKGDYIKLEGIEFYGGAILVENRADNNQILDCKIIHGSEGHDDLTNSGAQVPEASIEVFGDNTLIKGCTIDHSSVSGIVIAGWAAANCTVEGNTISNTDYVGIHASPIRTSGDGMNVLKNTIFNTGRDGIYVAGTNCEIAYNDVSNTQVINADSGVFYTVGNDNPKNNELHHNWFHDATAPSYSHNSAKGPAKAAGIYLDNDSKGWDVHHNVVWNVSWSGYQVNWNNVGLNFYHNTIWNAERAMDSWDINGPQENNKIYNNYANTGSWHTGTGPASFDIQDSPIFTNDPFEDSANQNFMPAAGSALVDAAPAIAGFSKTFVGASADIGAYERGGTAWTAGINAIEDTPVVSEPTIIQTIITGAEVETDGSDVPTSWTSTPASLTIEALGFTANANTTVTFFNQIKNAAGDQFAGGGIAIDIDSNGNGSVTFNPGFFGGGTLTSNQTATWRTNLGTVEKIQSFPVTIAGLSITDFANNSIASSISPNPVRDFLTVNVEEAETYKVYDLAGNIVVAQPATGSIDLSGVPTGIYLLVTEAGTAKVVVE